MRYDQQRHVWTSWNFSLYTTLDTSAMGCMVA
jgi:hypothetical protein